jgi:HEAT repeat protein
MNRERILELRKLQTERIKKRTTGRGPHFFGKAGAANSEEESSKAFEAIFETLLDAARDENDDVATGAIIALGKAGDERAIPTLMELANDPRADQTVHESAAIALGMIGKRGPEVRTFLSKIVADRRRPTRTRSFAALGLGFLGDVGAIPTLMARASVRESRYDVAACSLLGIGLLADEIVIPDLSRSVAGKAGERQRENVLRAYGAAGLGMLRSRAAMPALHRALGDKNVEVRRQAVLSLGALARTGDDFTLKTLAQVLGSDRDDQVRAFAAISLGESGAAITGDALRYAYRKGSAVVVPFAALSMGLLARNTEDPAARERILPFLRAQFKERGNLTVRGALAISLGIAGDREAVKPLLKVVTSGGSPDLRGHAAVALGLIGSEEALLPLRDMLKKRGNPTLQREVALALGLLGDREAERILTRLVLTAKTEFVRGSAAVALGRLASHTTAEVLRATLADESVPDTTRAFVAVALGLVVDRHEVPLLSRLGEHFNYRMSVEAVSEVLTFL